jgi:hypothetical protein
MKRINVYTGEIAKMIVDLNEIEQKKKKIEEKNNSK